MAFMSRKARSKEEVNEIVKAYANGSSYNDLVKKYGISVASLHRLIRVSRGEPPDPSKLKQAKKIERLEKTLLQQEKIISILKAALKKS